MPQGRDSLSLILDIKLGERHATAMQPALIHARGSLLGRGEMVSAASKRLLWLLGATWGWGRRWQ